MEHEKKVIDIIKEAIHKASVQSSKLKDSTTSKVKEAYEKSKPARDTIEVVAEDTLKGFSIAAKDAQDIASKAAQKIMGVIQDFRTNTSLITSSTLKGVKDGVDEVRQRKTGKMQIVPDVSDKGTKTATQKKPAATNKVKSTAESNSVKKSVKKAVKKSTKKVVKKAVKKVVKKPVKKTAQKTVKKSVKSSVKKTAAKRSIKK